MYVFFSFWLCVLCLSHLAWSNFLLFPFQILLIRHLHAVPFSTSTVPPFHFMFFSYYTNLLSHFSITFSHALQGHIVQCGYLTLGGRKVNMVSDEETRVWSSSGPPSFCDTHIVKEMKCHCGWECELLPVLVVGGNVCVFALQVTFAFLYFKAFFSWLVAFATLTWPACLPSCDIFLRAKWIVSLESCLEMINYRGP